MKTQIKSIVTVKASLVAAFASISLGIAGQQTPVKSLNLEQTRGNVRVVLLRAGRLISTNGQPEVVVTYVVEVPNKGAFSDLHFSLDNECILAVRGKPLECRGSSSSMGFKDLPRQNELSKLVAREGRSMLAEEILFRSLKMEAKKIDVKLQFSWRGQEMVFDFKDVPLN
jgi:hypothetical protein